MKDRLMNSIDRIETQESRIQLLNSLEDLIVAIIVKETVINLHRLYKKRVLTGRGGGGLNRRKTLCFSLFYFLL